jgi:hypothetical protein
MPESVFIQWCYGGNSGRYKLFLPVFFDEARLEDIRMFLKLMGKYSYQNEGAKTTLDQFFPAWEEEVKNRVEYRKDKCQAAERAMYEAQEYYKVNKRKRQEAARRFRLASDDVKRAKAALDRCHKIMSAYKEIKAHKF